MAANHDTSRTVVLAGGVGGSKLVRGLADVLPPECLTVIGNIGDDIVQHGLTVSPDMDILTYTLAGVVDEEKGWGYADETFVLLDTLKSLGVDTWMLLGDKDMATHIFRTELRSQGLRPTEIAARIAKHLGVTQTILPPCDEDVQTCVHTPDGDLNFQEFYLKKKCEPEIRDVSFSGSADARPTQEVLDAISAADLIVFAPSNPIASIGPILAVPGMREAIQSAPAAKVAVSPLVGGKCLKGPTLKMMQAVGLKPGLAGIAEYYQDLVDVLVVDESDAALADELGLEIQLAPTVMRTREDKTALAEKIVDEASRLVPKLGSTRRAASSTQSDLRHNYFDPEEPTGKLSGNLPHWRQEGTTYFVTFRLADALPQSKLDRWLQERDEWQAANPEPHTEAQKLDYWQMFPARFQEWLDAGYGDCVLAEPEACEIVEDALRHFDGERYRLGEFVVMPNHVHVVMSPLGEHRLSEITHSWKAFTAHELCKCLNRHGQIWQQENFDHIVRGPWQHDRINQYIERNRTSRRGVSPHPSR